jgi:cell division protein FtsQ
VRSAVQKLPWVRRVEVRKRWPDRLEVIVSEYRRWRAGAKSKCCRRTASLFPAPTTAMTRCRCSPGPQDRRGDLITLYSEPSRLFLGSGLPSRKSA